MDVQEEGVVVETEGTVLVPTTNTAITESNKSSSIGKPSREERIVFLYESLRVMFAADRPRQIEYITNILKKTPLGLLL